MKTTLKAQIVNGVATLLSITALSVQADVTTYHGPHARGVQTQNGGAVQTYNGRAAVQTQNGGAVRTRSGGGAVHTQNGTTVETRNGYVYKSQPTVNGKGKVVTAPNGTAVSTPNGTAVRTPNGVYTYPSNP